VTLRIVSFCFDDGFRDSSVRTAALFEARRVRAEFCVLAAPEEAADPYISTTPIGDWDLWRDLAAAGHVIAPHGWAHERLADQAPQVAIDQCLRTFDAFRRALPDFDPAGRLFHPAYLTAPAELVAWLGAATAGVRLASGLRGLNDPRSFRRGGRVEAITFGPDGVDHALAQRTARFLAAESGWLVLVLHGLDGEGWGPTGHDALAGVLDALLAAGAEIRPASEVALAA
jgi:peptidoglycan/xylan/chitin deacetylase (PgdA/CDA1 family)